MRKLVILFIFFVLCQQSAWANARSQLEKVNSGRFYASSSKQSLPDVKTIQEEKTITENKIIMNNNSAKDKNFAKDSNKKNVKNQKSSTMTNYQYDEQNYHYYKVQKYLKDNLDYSQSGKMKY